MNRLKLSDCDLLLVEISMHETFALIGGMHLIFSTYFVHVASKMFTVSDGTLAKEQVQMTIEISCMYVFCARFCAPCFVTTITNYFAPFLRTNWAYFPQWKRDTMTKFEFKMRFLQPCSVLCLLISSTASCLFWPFFWPTYVDRRNDYVYQTCDKIWRDVTSGIPIGVRIIIDIRCMIRAHPLP